MKKKLMALGLLIMFSVSIFAFTAVEFFVLGAAGRVTIKERYDGWYQVIKGIEVVRVIKTRARGGYYICNPTGYEIGFVKANGEVYKGMVMIGTVDMEKLLKD